MKVLLLSISIALITYGWFNNSESLITLGAIIFLFVQSINLYGVYYLSKHYQDAGYIKKVKKDSRIAKWLEGIITLFGLFALITDQTTGLMIWGGTIIIYFVGGIIIKEITGIPMRFGYGGWETYSPKGHNYK